MKQFKDLALLTVLSMGAAPVIAADVKVDVNLDIKHEVKGVSDFNRKKHITVHSALTEPDWTGEADTMSYLLNDLDVYFGRDNGMASWIFKATGQDPDNLGTPDIADLANFGQWHKDNMYDNLSDSRRAFESRSDEMIMGITPHGPFPTQSYWPKHLAGKDDEVGKYVLRHIDDGAEWVGEYLDQFFCKNGESSGVLMPKYWEVINEPDMDLNTGHTFVMSSFEQVFEYHNLVAAEIKNKLPEGQRPLIGGMTWGLHDFDKPDLSTRFPDQQKAVRNRYSYEAGDLEDFLQSITTSEHWDVRKDSFYQWDYLWKGFMDAAGDNMDFYSIHLYDWSQMGDDPRKGSTFRRGMPTEAILDMIEWYDAQVNGKENLKPWVISEYGAIASKHEKLEFITNDYRYADWLHLRTFNQMFMQILKRPSQVVKSMPFAPIKGEWGLATGPNGEAIRYEASLMQNDETLSENYVNADWYVTEKIQWYELWSDVKGTRVDTHSSDPDVQVDAYIDGNHTYLILNNLEWYDIPVDLSFMGINGNAVNRINMKHSYLAEGLSDINLGRPILAEAELTALPQSVTLQPGSTIILDIEFNDNIAITESSNEHKYYSESLSGAGKGQAAKGQVHRITGTDLTARVNGVSVPSFGEATLRIAGQLYPFHAANPQNNSFTINGHIIEVPTQINPNASGKLTEHYDYMGPEVDESSVSMNLIEIPIPLAFLQEDNDITAHVALAKAFTAVSISVWDMSKETPRSQNADCSPCIAVNGLSISGNNDLKLKDSTSLHVEVFPSNASNKTVVWSSSDVKIASVDQNGLVTGTGSGAATISVTTNDGSFTQTQEVNVSSIPPSQVTVDITHADLAANETLALNVSIEPFNATNKTIIWSTSDLSVASVSSSGIVTAINDGNAIIKATAEDGGVNAQTSINVTSLALESVDLASTAVIVLPGSHQPMVNFPPYNATNLSTSWYSANSGIANVNAAGLISGISEGATTITVTTNEGNHQDTIIVNVLNETSVTAPPTDVDTITMIDTGGPFSGFDISENGINNNQSGDWAEFEINFSEEGVYRFILEAGTPVTSGTGVEVFINGVSAGSAAIPTTGAWDVMQSTVVTNNLLVPTAGLHTIRIQSVGAEGAWQWNAGKMTFVLLSSLQPELDPDADPTDPVNPAEPIIVAGTDPISIEAETFIATGGTHNGVEINQGVINNNQTGDWVEYALEVVETGTYQLDGLLAVPGDAAGIEVSLVNVNGEIVYSSLIAASQNHWLE